MPSCLDCSSSRCFCCSVCCSILPRFLVSSCALLPDCEAQQVAQGGLAALGGRVVSDSFLPGERNLLLPLSQQQYFT